MSNALKWFVVTVALFGAVSCQQDEEQDYRVLLPCDTDNCEFGAVSCQQDEEQDYRVLLPCDTDNCEENGLQQIIALASVYEGLGKLEDGSYIQTLQLPNDLCSAMDFTVQISRLVGDLCKTFIDGIGPLYYNAYAAVAKITTCVHLSKDCDFCADGVYGLPGADSGTNITAFMEESGTGDVAEEEFNELLDNYNEGYGLGSFNSSEAAVTTSAYTIIGETNAYAQKSLTTNFVKGRYGSGVFLAIVAIGNSFKESMGDEIGSAMSKACLPYLTEFGDLSQNDLQYTYAFTRHDDGDRATWSEYNVTTLQAMTGSGAVTGGGGFNIQLGLGIGGGFGR